MDSRNARSFTFKNEGYSTGQHAPWARRRKREMGAPLRTGFVAMIALLLVATATVIGHGGSAAAASGDATSSPQLVAQLRTDLPLAMVGQSTGGVCGPGCSPDGGDDPAQTGGVSGGSEKQKSGFSQSFARCLDSCAVIAILTEAALEDHGGAVFGLCAAGCAIDEIMNGGSNRTLRYRITIDPKKPVSWGQEKRRLDRIIASRPVTGRDARMLTSFFRAYGRKIESMIPGNCYNEQGRLACPNWRKIQTVADGLKQYTVRANAGNGGTGGSSTGGSSGSTTSNGSTGNSTESGYRYSCNTGRSYWVVGRTYWQINGRVNTTFCPALRDKGYTFGGWRWDANGRDKSQA